MSTVTIRLTAASEKYLAGAENRTEAINNAIEAWSSCERQARKSLKGKFSASELAAFIDVCNGLAIPVSQANALIHDFEDACTLDCLDAKWNISKTETLEKMNSLTQAELIVLYSFCKAFWNKPEQDIKKYAEAIS